MSAEGSVFQRKKDGRWLASLDLPKGLDGRRRRVVRECKDEKDAKRVLRELHKESERGNLASANVILSIVIAAYLDTGLSADIRGVTRAGYRYALATYVEPTLGKRRLSDLTPALIVRWRDHLASEGRSRRTIQLANQQLGCALEWGRLRGLVNNNAVRDAGAVSQGKGRNPTVRLDRGQARAFLDAAKDDRDELLVLFLLGLGVRRSEMMGLRWDDFDAVHGVIRIARSVVEYKDADGTVVEVGDPKTEQSRRELLVPPYLLEALERHRAKQQRDRERSGAAWVDSGYILATEVGTLPYPSSVTSRLHQKQGMGAVAISRAAHVSRASVYRALEPVSK